MNGLGSWMPIDDLRYVRKCVKDIIDAEIMTNTFVMEAATGHLLLGIDADMARMDANGGDPRTTRLAGRTIGNSM